MTRRDGRRIPAQRMPGVGTRRLRATAVEHGAGRAREHDAVAREADGAVVQFQCERFHGGALQMSVGNVMLLSADSLSSGTSVGSSSIVAESSAFEAAGRLLVSALPDCGLLSAGL